ncbi:MAG: hypothetical protein JKX79_05760 [Labilibaculum sp.]|nr:hypothetical protein [Labilibaculum sp.]
MDGVRNPEQLWELYQEYIRDEKRQDVIDSLKGNYRKEYLFGIRQALQMWEQYQVMQKYCDKEIEKLLQKMTIKTDEPQTFSTPKRMKRNRPEVRTPLQLLE